VAVHSTELQGVEDVSGKVEKGYPSDTQVPTEGNQDLHTGDIHGFQAPEIDADRAFAG